MRRVSPRRILAALRTRLADARYAIEDLLYVSGRFLRRVPRAIGRGLSAFWWNLGLPARRRLVAALGTGVAIVLFLGLVVPTLPCQVPGAGPCPPADDAEDLVPSGALAYFHANLDPDSDQYEDAAEAAGDLPTITSQVLADAFALVPGRAGGRSDFARDIAPWFGGQVALAELPARRGADRVALLEADDADAAASFAADVAAGQVQTTDHRKVEIAVDANGMATAQAGGFLAIGHERAVRAVVDVATGAEGTSPIAAEPAASEVRAELPDHRLASAYLSPEGAERFVAEGAGPLASLAPFTSPHSTRGVALGLSAGDGELELAVRSAIDPERGRAEPGFFGAFAPFEPELPDRVPEGALAYVGFGDPGGTVEELLSQATAGAPGIAQGFEGLAGALRRDGDVDIERQLLPALGDEAAFVIEPRGEPGDGDGDPAPFLELVARDVDEDRARNALARLQRPIIDAIEPTVSLQAPVFRDLDVSGVEARSLRISPAIELTYAVADGLAVIATDPLGIERLVDGDGALAEADLFERATEGFPDAVSLLAFLDLRGLILVGEQLGLGADPAYGAFASEFRALRTLGLSVDLDDDVLATDARLIVEPLEEGEVPEPSTEPEAPPGLELPPETPGFEPPPESRDRELPPELQP